MDEERYLLNYSSSNKFMLEFLSDSFHMIQKRIDCVPFLQCIYKSFQVLHFHIFMCIFLCAVNIILSFLSFLRNTMNSPKMFSGKIIYLNYCFIASVFLPLIFKF